MNQVLKYMKYIISLSKKFETISGFSAATFSYKYRSSHWRCSVKKCSLKLSKFHRKPSVLESLLSRVAVFNFVKKRLQHRRFPMKFANFLRIPTLKNICERLLQ